MSVSSRRAVWAATLVAALSGACSEGGVRHVSDEARGCRDASECQDGLSCNGEELCEQGRCVAGAAPDCDDGDRCTLDGCNEGSGCVQVRAERAACLPEQDAAASEVALDAALEAARSDADASAPSMLSPPADLARAPEVECPTSVGSISASSNDALLAYRGVTCAAGALTIFEEVSDLSPLSQLRRVGSLDFRGKSSALAGLMALARIDGIAYIGPSDHEAATTLPALRWVGGDMRLLGLAPSSVPFPQLQYVGGALLLSAATPTPPQPTFPMLQAVGGALGPADGAESIMARFPALVSVGGSLALAPGVVVLESLGALRVAGALDLFGSRFAGRLSLPALERADFVHIVGNPQLTALDLPKLSEVSKLEVRLNPQLSRCQIDALLTRVGGRLGAPASVCCNQGCQVCNQGRCDWPGQPSDGQSTRLPREPYMRAIPVDAFTSVEQADELIFDYVNGAPMPNFALRQVGKLYVAYATNWTSLVGFSGLRSVDSLSLTGSGLVTLAGLHTLTRVGHLSIQDNEALRDISALDPERGARTLTGSLTISTNAQLSQCEAERIGRALAAGSDAGVRIERNAPCADAGGG
jgi:hypothetical protein